ncbi:MAG: hypothetical protein EXR72_11965 [Myxococcales bacterium]|nr:hypothetical protein [Myxococcales bacterium]
MRRLPFVAPVAVLGGLWSAGVGCTVENAGFDPRIDAAGNPVLRDLASFAGCQPPQRRCQAGGALSERCVGGAFQPDRACPIDSSCDGGYCRPPPRNDGAQGHPCKSESDCGPTALTAGYSCQPFVADPMPPPLVDLRCARQVGGGGSGVPCTAGVECRSGYCILERGTCFRACAGADSDCPPRGPVKLVCRPAMIRVEGTDVKLNSCQVP